MLRTLHSTFLLSPALAIASAVAGAGTGGPLLLADDTRLPQVRVQWEKSDGSLIEYEATLPYASPSDVARLGENVRAFIALGGSRLEKGAGHPDGAIVRVGLEKADRTRLFFTDIAHGADVTIELTGVFFNQPTVPDPETIVHRLEYKVEDVEACGLSVDQTEMFNVASEDDTMGGMILPRQVRFASLDGSSDGEGDVRVWIAADGSLSMRAVIPYRLLRHKGDPWGLEVPGTFFEPFRFDLEYQVLPTEIAEAEGVTPSESPAPAAR